MRVHEEALDEFSTCINTNKALKSQMIASVDEPRVRAKRHKCVGYVNVTTKELLDHMCASYTKIIRGYLGDNEVRMN